MFKPLATPSGGSRTPSPEEYLFRLLATPPSSASLKPQSKKASVDTAGIDINALIDGSGIVLD